MSTIDKLGIIGMRSYDPNHLEHIEFFKPLTVIWGHNGSGKTVLLIKLHIYLNISSFLDNHRMPEINNEWYLPSQLSKWKNFHHGSKIFRSA